MRLHRLTMTAFGPFGATVEIDFDQLSDAGLFLLSGATGAGKSSVLDGVCFALYGVVPGLRQAAHQLRSDHAADGVAPVVVLDTTIGERRFRFTRSPKWERPKRRGSGTTTQHATVLVQERRGDEWHSLSSRMDEAGDLVVRLLSMTPQQFTQVAMLPQGEFQAFLTAKSADRQKVLQRLFGTERFQRVEQWLVERRTGLRRDNQATHEEVRAHLSRLLEAGDGELPDGWDALDLATAARSGALLEWALELARSWTATATDLERERTSCTEAAETAARRLDAARAVVAARSRAEAATRRIADLDATAAAAAHLASRHTRHLAAQPVLPHLRHLADVAATARTAAARSATLVDALATTHSVPAEAIDTVWVAARREEAVGARAVTRALLPDEESLPALERETVALGAAADRADVAHQAALTTIEQLPAQVAEMRTRQAEAARTAAALPQLEHAHAAATAAHAAAVRAEQQAERLVVLQADLRAAVDAAQTARDVWQDAREARIEAMAAELAGALVAGCACPVCGSPDHPRPAAGDTGDLRADEQAARRAYDDAEIARQTSVEAVHTATTALAAARAAAGERSVDECADSLATATEHLTAARAADTEQVETAAILQGLVARQADADAELRTAADSASDAHTAHREAEAALAAVTVRLRSALEGTGHDTVTARLAALDADADALDSLDGALREAVRSDERHAAAMESAVQAADSAGFGCTDEAAAAVLSDTEAARAAAEIDRRRRDLAEAERVLAEPEVVEALAAEPVDLRAVTAAYSDADEALRRTTAAQAQARRAAQRTTALCDDLGTLISTWLPRLHAHDVAAAMASLAEGSSTDNALKVRLSAYVLGERLRDVIAAANQRLAPMTDQRFRLEQTDHKGVGEQRGGLSLLVRDEWSDTTRDPATLSGGETFVVSLALALGLADTVSAEAGGVDLGTLFIDEGFGSLDADTLEQVLDSLDELSSDRVVGVVSHVTEMRDRIPTQLVVSRGDRGGSAVRVRTAS